MIDRAVDESVPLAVEQLLYRQLYRFIADQITAGTLTAGDRLPAERDLGKRFAVGRTTVRRALAELERDGLVESFVGRGTFVSSGPVSESNALVSLTALGAARGLTTTSRVLRAETRPATADEAEAFETAPGSELFQLERLRLLDGYEFALGDSLVPVARVPNISTVDFSTASLYETLRYAGAEPIRAEYTISAAAADERTAHLLAIAPGDAVLLASTATFDHSRLVETSTVRYRADRYRMQTVLTKPR